MTGALEEQGGEEEDIRRLRGLAWPAVDSAALARRVAATAADDHGAAHYPWGTRTVRRSSGLLHQRDVVAGALAALACIALLLLLGAGHRFRPASGVLDGVEGSLVFVDDADGMVRALDVSSGTVRTLWRPTAPDQDPYAYSFAMSPDGQLAAYARFAAAVVTVRPAAPDDGPPGITFALPQDTGQPDIVWEPGGRSVLVAYNLPAPPSPEYTAAPASWEVHRLTVDERGRLLTDDLVLAVDSKDLDGEFAQLGALDREGGRVVVLGTPGENGYVDQIWILDVGTGRKIERFATGDEGYRSAGSPDGRWVAVADFPDGFDASQHVRLVDVRGARMVDLGAEPRGRAVDLVWSSDSRWLAWDGSYEGVYAARLGAQGWVRADPASTAGARALAFVPGTAVLLAGDRLLDLASGASRPFPEVSGCCTRRWTCSTCPTATPVAVVAGATAGATLEATRTESPEVAGTEPPEALHEPDLLPPAGEAVVWLDGEALWAATSDGVRELIDVGGVSSLWVSPTGRRLAYLTGDLQPWQLWVAELDAAPGTPPQDVMDSEALASVNAATNGAPASFVPWPWQLAWAPDDRALVFTLADRWDEALGYVERDDLWWLDLTGGPPRQLLGPGEGGPAVFSPDGTRLAISRSDRTQSEVSLLDLSGDLSDSFEARSIIRGAPFGSESEWKVYSGVAWDPSSQAVRLALGTTASDTGGWVPLDGAVELVRVGLDGRQATVAEAGGRSVPWDQFPNGSWSADGSEVAWVTDAAAPTPETAGYPGPAPSASTQGDREWHELWAAKGDGTSPRSLGLVNTPRLLWAPDGSQLLFRSEWSYGPTPRHDAWRLAEPDGSLSARPYISPDVVRWVGPDELLVAPPDGSLILQRLDGQWRQLAAHAAKWALAADVGVLDGS